MFGWDLVRMVKRSRNSFDLAAGLGLASMHAGIMMFYRWPMRCSLRGAQAQAECGSQPHGERKTAAFIQGAFAAQREAMRLTGAAMTGQLDVTRSDARRSLHHRRRVALKPAQPEVHLRRPAVSSRYASGVLTANRRNGSRWRRFSRRAFRPVRGSMVVKRQLAAATDVLDLSARSNAAAEIGRAEADVVLAAHPAEQENAVRPARCRRWCTLARAILLRAQQVDGMSKMTERGRAATGPGCRAAVPGCRAGQPSGPVPEVRRVVGRHRQVR